MKLRFTAASALAAAMLWGGSAAAAPSLDVNANAALDGTNFGLEVLLDGGTSAAFVQDNSPSAETSYRARFWLDVPSSLATSGNTRQQHMIFTGNPASGGPAGAQPAFRVWLLNEGGAAEKWRVRIWCRDNSLPFVKGNPITLQNAEDPVPRLIEVTWQQGSGDGSCSIQRFGGAEPIEEITGLTNDQLDIRRVRLGAISSIDAATTGSYYLDEFESFR